jgi:hypothetical protein
MFKKSSTYICWINIYNATLEFSGAVRTLQVSLDVKGLNMLQPPFFESFPSVTSPVTLS